MKIIVALLMTLPVSASAEDLMDQHDQEALTKTIELLKDEKARDEAISKDKDAQKADAYAKSVAGDHAGDVYGLSASVFEKLVKKYGTDMTKLNEVLQKALQDPAGFANSEFGEEDKAALKALAEKLPPANNPPK